MIRRHHGSSVAEGRVANKEAARWPADQGAEPTRGHQLARAFETRPPPCRLGDRLATVKVRVVDRR